MRHEAILLEYDRAAPALRAAGEACRARLATWVAAEPGIKLHSVTFRMKTRESLAVKLARPDRTYVSLWDVTDLAGLRVITYFEDGVDRVGELVEARLPVDFIHSIDKRRQADLAGFGYRSLHYVCRLDEGLPAAPAAARYEIQVRTMLEHAWAEIEHDLGYKSDETMPAVARRRLHRLAGLLELADQEFVAIRSDLEQYAAALPARIARESDAVPLDRLSLLSLLDCEEARGLDVEVAALLGKELGEEAFFPAYLLRMLAESGIATVSAARDGLTRHRPAILAMVKPYFAFASSAWSLAPERMERVLRGYSLFFLAHAAVLHAPSLGINKVERLAHLYRQIDYPDDEGAAHRVASKLVDAWGPGGK